MKRPFTAVGLVTTVLVLGGSAAMAQSAPAAAPAASSQSSPSAKQNLAEDIKLLRKDVRTEKSKIMGAAMGLDADQAKKFWPIYKDYDQAARQAQRRAPGKHHRIRQDLRQHDREQGG